MTGTEAEGLEPQLEPFDQALEESRQEFDLKLAQEKEPQLEPFDRALEESKKQFDLRLAEEKERVDRISSLAREKAKE